jgi:hypothetical protein
VPHRDNETRYAPNETTTAVQEIQHWHQRLHKWVQWTTGVLRPDNETRYRYNETSPPVQQKEQWHRRLVLWFMRILGRLLDHQLFDAGFGFTW